VSLSEAYPPLRDRCLTHAAVAREESNNPQGAAELFAQIEPGSRFYIDARLGLSRSLRKAGDFAGAAEALAPLTSLSAPMWGRDVGAEALIALADIARLQKDARAERSALARLWAAHPLSPLSEVAKRRLGTFTPDLESQVLRAESLLDAHRNKPALTALEPLLPKLRLPDALACRAHFAYGKGLRKEREHTRAIAALQPVVERCTDTELLSRALYVLGSSGSIVNTEVGVKAYERLVGEFPDHAFADDALFFAADLEVKRGRAEQALTLFDQVGTRYPKGDFLAESLFRAFWVRRTRGEKELARKNLETLEVSFADADETYEVERARYWRARMDLEVGDREKALAGFEAVAQASPATYYGLISRQRLSELDPDRFARLKEELARPVAAVNPWPLESGPLDKDGHFLAGVELLRMGLLDGASSELLATRRAGLPRDSLRLLVQLMSMAGDARSAHAISRTSLRRDLSGPITPENRPIWEVAYPNAFRPLIEKHCAAAKVDPDLLQALMREESALDPKALSWAGALGLTQLMPATAKGVAKTLKISNVTPQSLLEPDLNIRLGASYLGTLVQKFNGNLAYALAGYNAGALSVNRWREASGNKALDEWVEEIPIAETRGYVKRVLRTYNTYRLLYGRGLPARVSLASGGE
ncbi:MAG TPA: transglycosylase SLT domain-containing protein, partial [Myxococcaceae bacterium]|nr:transglycosylase SLT domain-containing protein [Myxococcaceae bacterium]